jgi:hypothetical protein
MRHRALEEPLPSLVIAVAFAVDTALKQDGNWRHRRARSNSSTHKQRGGQGPASRDAGAPEQPKRSTGEVVDLAAALQGFVNAAKTSRGEPADDSGGADTHAGHDEDAKPAKKDAGGDVQQERHEVEGHGIEHRREGQLADFPTPLLTPVPSVA